jgi:hypothetical protein
MTELVVLGPPLSRTTDGSRTTWNIFGNTPIPEVVKGMFFYSNDKLIYDECASNAKPPTASRIIEHVGNDEEIAEIPITGTFVPLPAGTSSVAVTMDSAMKTKSLLVRRRRQQASASTVATAEAASAAAETAEAVSAPQQRQGTIAVRVTIVVVLIIMAVLLSIRNI